MRAWLILARDAPRTNHVGNAAHVGSGGGPVVAELMLEDQSKSQDWSGEECTGMRIPKHFRVGCRGIAAVAARFGTAYLSALSAFETRARHR
jgi:hypothetical protein